MYVNVTPEELPGIISQLKEAIKNEDHVRKEVETEIALATAKLFDERVKFTSAIRDVMTSTLTKHNNEVSTLLGKMTWYGRILKRLLCNHTIHRTTYRELDEILTSNFTQYKHNIKVLLGHVNNEKIIARPNPLYPDIISPLSTTLRCDVMTMGDNWKQKRIKCTIVMTTSMHYISEWHKLEELEQKEYETDNFKSLYEELIIELEEYLELQQSNPIIKTITLEPRDMQIINGMVRRNKET